MAAALGMTELVALDSDVNVLGGSGEQSKRVHEHMRKMWLSPGAPRAMLASDPAGMETRLVTGATIKALKASQASVRGPHPARLIIDELDEVSEDIFKAALGQPMNQRGVMSHLVLSSTHQYADGTMTKALQLAAEKGWSVHEWCLHESLAGGTGWLTQEMIDRSRQTHTAETWATEVELQAPNPADRAIMPEKVEAMFDRKLGDYRGDSGEYIEVEPPKPGGKYSTGADWAKKSDYTSIVTWRHDVTPVKLVAFERLQRRPWPDMTARLDTRQKRYNSPPQWRGSAFHDGTGLGDVVADTLNVDARAIIMVGRQRSGMLSDYIGAIERGEMVAPMIRSMYGEHLYASVSDVYGEGHLPDTMSAGALGWIGIAKSGWSRGSSG